jgi:hypothetical protein
VADNETLPQPVVVPLMLAVGIALIVTARDAEDEHPLLVTVTV